MSIWYFYDGTTIDHTQYLSYLFYDYMTLRKQETGTACNFMLQGPQLLIFAKQSRLQLNIEEPAGYLKQNKKNKQVQLTCALKKMSCLLDQTELETLIVQISDKTQQPS